MWHTHTMVHYSVIKTSKVLIHATTSINLKIILREEDLKKGYTHDSFYMKHPG